MLGHLALGVAYITMIQHASRTLHQCHTLERVFVAVGRIFAVSIELIIEEFLAVSESEWVDWVDWAG